MYQFSPITERIGRLRDKVRDRVIIADPAKSRIKREAQAKYKNYPPVVQKPAESLYVISHMPIDIVEDEYFAGDVGNQNWGASSGAMWAMMDVEHTWIMQEDGLYHAPDTDEYSHQKLAISPENLKELRDDMAKNRPTGPMVRAEQWLPEGAQDLYQLQATPFGRPGGFGVLMPPGHLTPGFQTILKRGYGDIRKQAQDWLDEHKGNVMGNDMGKYMF